MTIQEQMRKDLTEAIRNRDEETKSAIRVALAEFSREPTKTIPDVRAIKILNSVLQNAKDLSGESPFTKALEKYIPNEASDDEIKTWVKYNIDFSTFKNKMQAMKPIMAAFAGRADGNRVKAILEGL